MNVPPGFYDLKVYMIGYETKTITDLRVEIDLTANIDISISTEAIEGDMIFVKADQNLVKVDIASSKKSISGDELAEMPVNMFKL